jgi:hypothetical protein
VKYLSNFSGGACSLWATKRKIDEHGAKSVVPIFADTLYESPDLYEFNLRAQDFLGVQLVRICVGLTPWQLFRREGLIANDRFPICSTKLKREPLNAWMEANYELDLNQANWTKEHGTVVLGFDFSEWNRVNDFQNQHPTWSVSAPMTDEPLWDKCKMLRECERAGFKIPKLYQLGFPHNNCGGFCVKAGISHFVHLLKVLPVKYAEAEREEMETQHVLAERGVSNAHFTILKDRRGGVTGPLSLKELRMRVEGGEKFRTDEWGGCGCGGAS